MKKVLYIGIAIVALGLASCSKQDIQPNSSSDVVVPVWKSNTADDGGVVDPSSNGTNNDGSPIVDPNEDPEISNSGL